MWGWWIAVFRQAQGGHVPASADGELGTRLAVWQTPPNGLNWLNELVRAGDAIALGGNGYPLWFTARSDQLLPPILGGPPHANPVWNSGPDDLIDNAVWLGRTTIYSAAVDSCRPDEWLVVEAWDES
jgi:hypothetical protein